MRRTRTGGRSKKIKREDAQEEKTSDDDVYMEEEHSEESDREHLDWERSHGQEEPEDEEQEEELSDLSENEVQSEKLLVEVCCSEKTRLTSEARMRGWKAVRVTKRSNIYRPRTLRKLRKLLDPEKLEKKGDRGSEEE